MPVVIRALIRIAFGLLGLYWVVVSLFGIIVTGRDRAWGAFAQCALFFVLGLAVTYAAFVRAPWERKSRMEERAV